MKSAEFFAAATYPELTVVSTSFVKKGDDEYKLTADVNLHGVTNSVTFDVEHGGEAADFYGNHKAGFGVTGKIGRKEFGLTWSGVTEADSIMVSDDVKLSATLQFVKQAETVAAV